MWLKQPDKPGFWLFKGLRSSRSKKALVKIAAPVHVKDEKGYPERMVYYSGSGMPYGVSQHQGEWFWLGELLNDK
jgi:hypothetical protein